VPELSPALLAGAGVAYLAVLLAADRFASHGQQLALGALTWVVLAACVVRIPPRLRAQTLGVILFATCGEVVGSLIWGVYTYRLENLPLFVPPGHGIVFLTGLALALALRRHANLLVAGAAAFAVVWAAAGLLGFPRLDVAGAIGIPVLLAFFCLSRNRAIYAGVFLVVAALEFYGTAIGTWLWHPELPGLGIPNGNPPSGVAAGYVWFDVMALLVAPLLLPLVSPRTWRTRRAAAAPLG
jgi:hypothetical protein